MSQRIYLVSKRLDPLLGVVSGIWGYYLFEQRAQRAPGTTLSELVTRKCNIIKNERELSRVGSGGVAAAAEDEGWKEIEKELQDRKVSGGK